MSSGADLLGSLVILSAVAATINSIRNHAHNLHIQAQQRRDQAFSTYVQTGVKDPYFCTLSTRTMKIAESKRAQHIHRKAKENNKFTAMCECPRCNNFATHYIKKIRFAGYFRECQNCNFTWRQK